MMQSQKLKAHSLNTTIATINHNRNKRLSSHDWHLRCANNVSTVEDALHFLQTLYQSTVPQELMLRIGLSGKLPDLPAIYWCGLLDRFGDKDDLYVRCYAKADGATSALIDDVFSDQKKQKTPEQVCRDLEQGSPTVYFSATVLDNNNAYQHLLFTVEHSGKHYRITEFSTNRKMPNHFRFAVQKVYYAKNMHQLIQAVETIFSESISLSEFIDGKKPTQAVDAICLDFLDDMSFYQNQPLTQPVSGLAVTCLAKRIFPLSLIHNIVDNPDFNDIFSSKTCHRQNRLIQLLTRVHLDVSSVPDVRCHDGKVTVSPGKVSSIINTEAMAKYPIVQGLDPRMPHDTFNQPHEVVGITHGTHFRDMRSEDLSCVINNINALLQNPEAREQQEYNYYDYTTIYSSIITNKPSSCSPYSAGTSNSNGVVAKKDIFQYTPVIYKQQYAEQDSLEQCAIIVAMRNYAEYGLNMYCKVEQGNNLYLNRMQEESFSEAHRLRGSYSWRILPCEVYSEDDGLKTRELWTNGWGAGGIASSFNADFSEDKTFVNHACITCKTVDKQGNLAPPIVVYFSFSDIEKGQELLVDSGQHYELSHSAKGNILAVNESSMYR